jgi:hypothetical protein
MFGRKKLTGFSGGRVVFTILILISVVLAFVMSRAYDAMACDEGGLSGFVIQAPLDSAPKCTATPATISVLGLTIDVSEANFGEGHPHNSASSCTDLQSGEVVYVTLASEATPLTATSVRPVEHNQSLVIVGGVLQAVDTTKNTVEVLGLTIDVSKATLQSDNDQSPALSQLIVGQFVLLTLPSNATPLSATTLFFHLIQIFVEAPLDSAPDCTATPPTISVLGLSIDISKATLNKEGWGGGTLTCTDLTAGQTVTAILASAAPPLAATEVNVMEGGCWCDHRGWADVEVSAPLMSITTGTSTPPTTTVTVLGTLDVNITNAFLVAGWGAPITLQDLVVGQYVKMTLASNIPPLTAEVVEVENPGSLVTFQVYDENHHHVDDGDVKDVSADVTVTEAGKKPMTFHTTSSGDFGVANMPSGQSKVVVTRVNSGQASQASNVVNVNAKTKNVSITLKPVNK